jgi:3-hydroxyacyl-CoA dehydrogenase
MKEVKVVTVIGATGTMGANVAGIFAAFGNAKVYIVGRDIEKVRNIIPRIVGSVKADSIIKNLIPADYTALETCVAESDLVFESLSENMELKIEMASKIAGSLREDAISCTGTSGLSVTTIAEVYPQKLREHFFGVHMFNPPYSMPLCELVSTIYTDKSMQKELHKYLETVLFRTVAEVMDSPAFLGNRIGFQFINEVLQYAEHYKNNGGIDYMDAILGPFSGRAMAPLLTSDFVGLDIHKAIVDNIYENTKDYAHNTFVFPEFSQKLVLEDRLGRKSGEGFYQTQKYDNGKRRQMVLEISTGRYRDKVEYVFPFAEQMKRHIARGNYEEALSVLVNRSSQEAELCVEFLLKYMIYSFYVTKEIGCKVEFADDVMAAGFNWCPPLAMYHFFSMALDVKALIHERLKGLVDCMDLNFILADLPFSKYDYRRYFKA